ncbi:hypothetical protein ACU8OG_26605 (plasmid) [Rhizobium leguminosarum]
MSSTDVRPKRFTGQTFRSFRIDLFCGILIFTALPAVALADDVKAVVDKVLDDAIVQTRNILISMSEGCSGGAHGVPPFSWGALQPNGFTAVQELNNAKSTILQDKNPEAIQHIQLAGAALDALVNGVHNNCSGGANGVDPVYYDKYQVMRATLRAKLDVISELLK